MPLLVRRLPPTTTTSPLSCAPAAGFTPLSAATARGLHPAWVVLVISLWLASACNVPLWRALAALPGQGSLRDWGFALMFGLIVAAGHAALLSLLAWRLTLKPAVTVLLLMAGGGAYFMLAYGILIDADSEGGLSEQIKMIQLNHANAETVATLFQEILQAGA